MAIIDLINSNPVISIVAISFTITLAMTLVTKYFTDQKLMKELKVKQKELQKKLKEKKGDLELQKKIQKEMMGYSMELMKHSFKPMIITFIPIILIFWWIRGIYLETTIGNVWIWWYIGSALVSSIILRKAMDVA
jgi:uncharacterized membrane protein (DUF106 family)